MGDNQTVQVDVIAAIGDFKTQMAAAAASLAAAVRAMGGSLREVESAAGHNGSGANGALEKLSDKLREHRSEHVQTARAVKVFTAEIASVIGPANELTGILGGLAGGLAAGGVLGVALEGGKLLFEHLAKEVNAAKAAVKQSGKEIGETSEKIGKSWEALFARLDKTEANYMSNAVQRANEQVLKDLQVTLRGRMKKIQWAMEDDQRDAESALKRAGAVNPDAFESGKFKKLRAQLDDLRAKGEIIAAEIQENQKKANQGRGIEQGQQDTKANDAAANAALAAAKVQAQKLAALNEQYRQKDIAADKWVEDEKIKGLADAAKRAKKILEQQAAEEQQRSEAQKKKFEEIQAQAYHYLTPLRHAFDRMFEGILDGSMNISQVWDTLWKGMLKTVVDALVEMGMRWAATQIAQLITGKVVAMQQVASEAAVAGAATVASTAAIPIFGPMMAMEAGAAMYADVLATYGPLASAAGGWAIPRNLNPVVQAHAGEHIIPADIAKRYEDGAPGGGGGGDLHVHLHSAFIDGAGVKRMVRSPEFRSAVRAANRNREL